MGIRSNIATLQAFAIAKGGLLLSTEYIDNKYHYLWKCKEGHEWLARWDSVGSHGCWCKKCAYKTTMNHRRVSISELQGYAASNGGRLISIDYTGNKQKLLWECKNRHQWEVCWHTMKSDLTWCPLCCSGKTEERCRALLEAKLGVPFVRTRFRYDKANWRICYEFDGYNEEHKIAFEYNGRQHYEYPNHCHKTEQLFKEQQQRDLNKINYAKDNGIRLIIIPCSQEYNLEKYIDKQLKNLIVDINKLQHEDDINNTYYEDIK